MPAVYDTQRHRIGYCLLLLVVLLSACGRAGSEYRAGGAQDKAASFEYSETVVAGGVSDFMEVRHIVLRGSNLDIGVKLAEIAASRHDSRPLLSYDPVATEEQRRYFSMRYPVFSERMRGVARATGKELEDNTWNFASLPYRIASAGCSVVYYPPGTTADGFGVLSRNFDFTTGTFEFTEPGEASPAVCARPYVVELHPDKGYATLVMCCFDLLGGACDGINSEGLTVALLADGPPGRGDVRRAGPSPGPRAGFDEIQTVRYLLDSCADIEEAEKALGEAQLYYRSIPCHYVIADSYGGSFIWENSPDLNGGTAVRGEGGPLVSTNFLQHLYDDVDDLPAERYRSGSFERFREIRRRVSDHKNKFDRDFIIETNRRVALSQTSPPNQRVTNRTLWHTLYFPVERSMEVDFYLGEEQDRIRRSGYITFTLAH